MRNSATTSNRQAKPGLASGCGHDAHAWCVVVVVKAQGSTARHAARSIMMMAGRAFLVLTGACQGAFQFSATVWRVYGQFHSFIEL